MFRVLQREPVETVTGPGAHELRLAFPATPQQAQDVHAFIRGKLAALDSSVADKVRILYGGSMNAGNAAELLAMADIDHSIDTMVKLKQLGIRFSMDDFGTGYSSLSYLHQLPIDELKIDQSFVRNISSSPENEAIVDTIIAMAQQLNLEIVAEGVESPDELNYLISRQCNYFQGYHFSRPIPFHQFGG